ncbi:DMT family transporter [Roseovarius sp. 2305UL8-3]|uniref:DMT family transporter n=1 Tax=Roseovarius conchicola TaxID=3121636 RepID=UPI003526DFFD
MPQSTLFAVMLVAFAGALISVQAPMNAALGRGIGSPLAAAAVSFAVGLLVLVTVVAIVGDTPAFLRLNTVSPWLLLGGAMGAVFVFSSLWAVPILGVLTTAILLILGQLIAAIILDYFGVFGIAPRDISLTRLLAVALVAAGAVLSQF